MPKPPKHLVSIIIAAALVSVLVVSTKNTVYNAATNSCLKSIAAHIKRTHGKDLGTIPRVGDWVNLNNEQLIEFHRTGREFFDCKSRCKKMVCDAWGRPVDIAYKFVGDSLYVKVLSMGADETPSSDDLLEEVVLEKASLTNILAAPTTLP